MVSIQIKGRRRFSTPKSHKVTWDSLCSFIRVKEPPAFPITFELVIEVTVPGGGRNNKILTYESVLREAEEWLLVTQLNISKLVSMADPPSVFSFGLKSSCRSFFFLHRVLWLDCIWENIKNRISLLHDWFIL